MKNKKGNKRYIDKVAKIADKLKYYNVKCKCGHTNTMSAKEEKKICNWCGNYVFRNKQAEFEYRLRERINKR